MQAAANRSAAPRGARPAAKHQTNGVRASADDAALLDALPIAAGVFGLRHGKLWVHALNARFFALAGCDADPKTFADFFHRYADSSSGAFVQDYLKDSGK